MAVNCKKYIYSGLALFLFAAGCQEPIEVAPPERSLLEVVEPYNSAVAAVEPIYATMGRWVGQTGSGKDKERHSDSGGKLFYSPPAEPGELPKLYIQFNSFNVKALVVVSDETCYGMYSEADKGGGAWGYHKNVGSDCSRAFPLDIQALLESLTLKPIPLDKVYSYKQKSDYNIIEYINPESRLMYLHELCFDKFDNVPRKINIYSWDGRLVVSSNLGKYQEFEGMNLPLEIKLEYLPEDASLEMKLKKYNIDSRNRDMLYQMTIDKAREFEQLDASCGE